ncbi:hypothetical protein ES708_08708 [subsurface metagenome]
MYRQIYQKIGLILAFMICFTMSLVPAIILLTPKSPTEFDKLYEQSRDALVIRDIQLELNETFEFKFAVKKSDMFLFRYETYNYGMLLNIELIHGNIIYEILSDVYYIHKHYDYFIDYTGIIICRLTNTGNKWEIKTGHVDLFIIVYDQYFPPTVFPNLN